MSFWFPSTSPATLNPVPSARDSPHLSSPAPCAPAPQPAHCDPHPKPPEVSGQTHSSPWDQALCSSDRHLSCSGSSLRGGSTLFLHPPSPPPHAYLLLPSLRTPPRHLTLFESHLKTLLLSSLWNQLLAQPLVMLWIKDTTQPSPLHVSYHLAVTGDLRKWRWALSLDNAVL